MSSTDEVDAVKARRPSSTQSPPRSAGYARQQSDRYTKEPSTTHDAEAWPDKRPPSLPNKAGDQPLKTDKDGYLETSIGASSYDDRCSGYLDAVEPAPSGNHPELVSWSLTSLFSTNMAISETNGHSL